MRKGFTLMEVVIAISIMIVLGLVTTLNLSGGNRGAVMNSTAQQIGITLRQAQSNAMSQQQSSIWGVYFSNTSSAPFFALYYGSYSTGTIRGYYRLPNDVAYLPASLAVGATTSITFAEISGMASVSRTITLYVPSLSGVSTTISIASSGVVAY